MRCAGLRHGPAQRRPAKAIVPSVARNVRAMGGVYVPSDSFGGQSPERKAAGILRTFFTFVAARVVLAQLEGSGRGALGAYDSKAATDLHHFLQNVPLKDGDEWLSQLMRQNSSLGLRLMEVRDHYCEEAFEWDQLQRIARQDMKGANTKLMKHFAAASLAASLIEMKEAGPGSDADGNSGDVSTAVAAPSAATATTTAPASTSASSSAGAATGNAEADAASAKMEAAAATTETAAAAAAAAAERDAGPCDGASSGTADFSTAPKAGDGSGDACV